MSYLELSNKVGRVYAEALYEIATAQGKVGEVYQQLHDVRELFETEADFRRFLTSPRIADEHKKDALKEAFGDKLNPLVLNTLSLMIDKGREGMIDNLAEAFGVYRDEAENRVHVYITSAKQLDDATRDAIKAKLTTGDVTIDLHEKVDESLISGLKVRVKDYVVDSSARARIQGLRKAIAPHINISF